MLQLIDIKKDYAVAGEYVHALKGVSVKFRSNEFVSVLGPSGCGKTTLLNIIGGLDHYTSGDLIIEGKSTKQYKDGDWDTYRNHSIGFIFQSYHLIPHQTILQNVELALMISGIPKKERRQRAIDALEKVGLGDKINNRPNQLSGGQAQRVAIARALINDPEIVLADEPTGALDSKTSVQIMELLKEIAQDRLVIMVTHNPELAEEYSTRIIRLLDGLVVDDSMPYDGEDEGDKESVLESAAASGEDEEKDEEKNKEKNKGKKASMSIGMAMGLSLKNLLSKGRRTAMVSVAGSIGIIGVSMVLAISAGVQGYIRTMENDMLSGNPVSITQSTYDFTSLMSLSRNNANIDLKELAKGNKVYVNSLLNTLGTFAQGFEKTNNITEAYVDYVSNLPEESVNVVQYDYAFNIVNNIYTDFKVSDSEEKLKSHFREGESWDFIEGNMSVAAIRSMYSFILDKVEEYNQWGGMISTVKTFEEVPDNFDYVMSQYDVLAVDVDGNAVTKGYSEEHLRNLFDAKETLIMVVSDYQFNDLMLAEYGYFTEEEFLDYAFAGVGKEDGLEDSLVGKDGFPYSFFVGDDAKKFTYYPNDSIYSYHEYKAQPKMSDAEIYGMIKMYAPMVGLDDEQAGEIAQNIIAKRNESNEALFDYLTSIPAFSKYVSLIYEACRMPDGEVTRGYIANAYSTQYKIKEFNVTLPAFEDTEAFENRVDMGIKLILQKKPSVSYGCLDTGLYYTNALTQYALETEAQSEIVKYATEHGGSLEEVPTYVDYYFVDETEEGDFYVLETKKSSIDRGVSMMDSIIGSITSSTSSKITAAMLGGSKLPTAIYLYAVDFTAKDTVTAYLDAWNAMCETEGGYEYTYTDLEGNERTVTLEVKDKITYTDAVGLIIGMINTMIQMITIALVAFTALSLVVSTVMIGIITYVSVVERIKEIGILRAVGARKKDIKRLFNAETFIIGLTAGVFGIIITYLLSLIVNVIVLSLAGIWGIAALPWWQAAIMIVLSVVLTLISGLIPASAAAKKDPVVALRTE